MGGSAVNTRLSHFMNNDATVFSPRVNFSPEAQEQHRAARTRLKRRRAPGDPRRRRRWLENFLMSFFSPITCCAFPLFPIVSPPSLCVNKQQRDAPEITTTVKCWMVGEDNGRRSEWETRPRVSSMTASLLYFHVVPPSDLMESCHLMQNVLFAVLCDNNNVSPASP